MKANRHVTSLLAASALLAAGASAHRPALLPPPPSAPAPVPVRNSAAAEQPVLAPSPAQPAARKDAVAVLATAYSTGASCNGPWGAKNALGGRLKSGKLNSAAADWSRFPLGTRFRVVETGKVYVVDDYGSAMVGKNKVDLFMPDYGQVRRWGKRNVTLEILEWGSHEKSLEVLRPRSKAPYIRQMVRDLREKVEDQG